MRPVDIVDGYHVRGPASPIGVHRRWPTRSRRAAPASLAAVADGGRDQPDLGAERAADLAGYLVLRGEAPGATLTPLMTERRSRDDVRAIATVQPGRALRLRGRGRRQGGQPQRGIEPRRKKPAQTVQCGSVSEGSYRTGSIDQAAWVDGTRSSVTAGCSGSKAISSATIAPARRSRRRRCSFVAAGAAVEDHGHRPELQGSRGRDEQEAARRAAGVHEAGDVGHRSRRSRSTFRRGPAASITKPRWRSSSAAAPRASRPRSAMDYVLGVTCLNDVTARELQVKDVQYTRAKGFDTFAPIGPCIAVGLDPSNLGDRRLGQRREAPVVEHQPADLPVPELVEFVTRFCTLEPGDIITTGTPSGVGPLKPGDRVMVEGRRRRRAEQPVRLKHEPDRQAPGSRAARRARRRRRAAAQAARAGQAHRARADRAALRSRAPSKKSTSSSRIAAPTSAWSSQIIPGDGVVTGHGRVNGRVVYALRAGLHRLRRIALRDQRRQDLQDHGHGDAQRRADRRPQRLGRRAHPGRRASRSAATPTSSCATRSPPASCRRSPPSWARAPAAPSTRRRSPTSSSW